MKGERGNLTSLGEPRLGMYARYEQWICDDCGTDFPRIDGQIMCNGRGIIRCPCAGPDERTARIEEECRARAEDGALLLDEHDPKWAEKITRPISMILSTECVLGQLYQSYGRGHIEVFGDVNDNSERSPGWEERDGIHYGFLARSTQEAKLLRVAWEQEIKRRTE